MKKTMRFLPLAVLFMLACTSDKQKQGQQQPPPTPVDVLIAAPVDLSDMIECNGSAMASESVELHVETAGRLVEIYRQDGAAVRSGQLLAKVNDAELQAQLRQQQVQLDLAKKQQGRLEQLVAMNGVNQADYDEAVNKVAVLEAAIDVTRAQIEKTESRARFDGVLGLRMVSPGAYVTPQTVLGSLQERGSVKVDFSLPEQYRSVVKTGMTVVVRTATDSATASITAIDPQVNSTTRNIRCRAQVRAGAVVPGAFVKVLVPRITRCIAVPSQCIIPDAISDKVMTVKSGKGVFAPIRTGARTRGHVQVMEGINEGDTVIVTGVLFVRPGNPVTIRSVKEIDAPVSGNDLE